MPSPYSTAPGSSYSVEVDPQHISNALALFEFVGGNVKNAQKIAINKTTRKVRSSTTWAGGGASQRVREQAKFKVSYVNRNLTIDYASPSRLEGKIKTPGRGALLSVFATNLNNFATAEPKVQVKPSGRALVVRGNQQTTPNKPFYMVLPDSGVVAIVARRNRPGPRGGKIKAFYGPSLSQVFTDVKDEMTPDATNEYQTQLLDAMRYLLSLRYPPEA